MGCKFSCDDVCYPDGRINLIIGLPINLSNFKKMKIIGRGSFGKVYKVTDIKLNKIFAMKIMNKAIIFNKRFVENALNELQMMSKISHPY